MSPSLIYQITNAFYPAAAEPSHRYRRWLARGWRRCLSVIAAGCASIIVVGCPPNPQKEAEQASAVGDYAKAASLLGPLVNTGGDEIRLEYGLALARSGSVQEAAGVLSELPEAARTLDVELILQQGQLLSGETESVLSASAELAESHPRSSGAQLLRAEALANAGRLSEAAQFYRNALALEPTNSDAHTGLGDVAFAAGDLAAAEQFYGKGRELGGEGPAGVKARTRLARLMAATGRGMEAEAMLQEAMALQPGHPHAVAEFGKHLVRSGYFEEAVASLSEAQQALGEDAELMSYLGFVYLRRAQAQFSASARVRDLQAAQMWLERAATKEPGRADIHNNLGQVKGLLGDLEGAEEAFKRAWKVAPKSIESLMNLSSLYAREGYVERAQGVLQKALDTAPQHVIVQMNLGVLALRTDDNDAAAAWFEKAAKSCANTGPAHACHAELAYALARLAGRRGDVEAGVTKLSEALAFGFSDVGRIDAEPELEAIRADIRIANQMDRLRLRISN